MTTEFEKGEQLRGLKLPPRCPFCGKYVRCYLRVEGIKKRLYADGEEGEIIAECRNCGQIDGFMDENPDSIRLRQAKSA